MKRAVYDKQFKMAAVKLAQTEDKSVECVRFQFLKENQKKYNIKKACRILKISRSGYYEYLHRRKSRRSIENGL